MAKGQIKGNRETRKPKKDKAAAPAQPQQGFQVKQASSPAPTGKKGK